jgi:hypothetical protein
MAPEIINRQHYNNKADIWSLGITVIEMATGSAPFADQDPRRALFLIPKSKPPKLNGNEFSSAIKDFIYVCLKEDPEDRLACDELLRHKFIRNVVDGQKSLRKLLLRHQKWQEENQSSEDEEEIESDLSDYVEWDFETVRTNSPQRYSPAKQSPTQINTSLQGESSVAEDSTPRPSTLGLSMIGPWNISQTSINSTDSLQSTSNNNRMGSVSSATSTNIKPLEEMVPKPETTPIRGRLLHAKPTNADVNRLQSGWQGTQGWQGWASGPSSAEDPRPKKTIPSVTASAENNPNSIPKRSHQNTTSASSLSIYLEPRPVVGSSTESSPIPSRSATPIPRSNSPAEASANAPSVTSPIIPKPILKRAERTHNRTHSRQVSISLPNKEALNDALLSIKFMPIKPHKRTSSGSVDVDIGDPVIRKMEHVIRLLEQLERTI